MALKSPDEKKPKKWKKILVIGTLVATSIVTSIGTMGLSNILLMIAGGTASLGLYGMYRKNTNVNNNNDNERQNVGRNDGLDRNTRKKLIVRRFLEIYTKEENFILKNIDEITKNSLEFYRGKRHALYGRLRRGTLTNGESWKKKFISVRNFAKILHASPESFWTGRGEEFSYESLHYLYKSVSHFMSKAIGTESEASFREGLKVFNDIFREESWAYYLNYKIVELANNVKKANSKFINMIDIVRILFATPSRSQIFNTESGKKSLKNIFDIDSKKTVYMLDSVIDKLVRISLVEDYNLIKIGIERRKIKNFREQCKKLILEFLTKSGTIDSQIALDGFNVIIDSLLALNHGCSPTGLIWNWELGDLAKELKATTGYFRKNLKGNYVIENSKITKLRRALVMFAESSDLKERALKTVDDYKIKYKNMRLLRYNERISEKIDPWWAKKLLKRYSGDYSGDEYEAGEYSKDWKPQQYQRFIELLIKQAGMMPTGEIQNYAEFANFEMISIIAPHHIKFNKPSSDPKDIILMGRLHKRLMRHVEPRKDLDYYAVMRVMKDSFEEIQPAPFWNDKLQGIYCERIKFIINQWRANKGDDRHIRLLGLTKEVIDRKLARPPSGINPVTRDDIEAWINYLESNLDY